MSKFPSGDARADGLGYCSYEIMVELLNELATTYEKLLRIQSIGKSHQGRDLWATTLTSFADGEPEDKPALYVDGGMHATEVVGSAAAMYLINHLVTSWEGDEAVRELLRERTVYVIPRFNPDGVERFLTDGILDQSNGRPRSTRSLQAGVTVEDIDGDGHIRTMRWKDPCGEWRVSSIDPRLMVRCNPNTPVSERYRVVEEGRIVDGGTLRRRTPAEFANDLRESADLNHDWPAWPEPESSSVKSLTQPETAAIAAFIEAHPNICFLVNLHASGGVLLSPSGPQPDDPIWLADSDLYKTVEQAIARTMDYESKSIPQAGPGLLSWAWMAHGIVSVVPELWDVYKVATGIGVNQVFAEMTDDVTGERMGIDMLKWSDRELQSGEFVDWRAVKHPDLGEVEVGGWNAGWTIMNPPQKYLPGVQSDFVDFILEIGRMTPALKIGNVIAKRGSGGLVHVSADLENWGWMPTSGSQRSVDKNFAVEITIDVEGGKIQGHEDGLKAGHLRGTVDLLGGFSMFRPPAGAAVETRKRVEFVADVGNCDFLVLTARTPRAGFDRKTVTIED